MDGFSNLQSSTLRVMVLKEISKNEKGLSAWDIEQIFDRKVTFQRIQPYLKNMEQAGILKKVGSKYLINSHVVIYKGAIVAAEPMVVLNCPYYNNGCNCKGEIKKECRYLKELPKPLAEFIKQCVKNDS